jgi:hypothetical protein
MIMYASKAAVVLSIAALLAGCGPVHPGRIYLDVAA